MSAPSPPVAPRPPSPRQNDSSSCCCCTLQELIEKIKSICDECLSSSAPAGYRGASAHDPLKKMRYKPIGSR